MFVVFYCTEHWQKATRINVTTVLHLFLMGTHATIRLRVKKKDGPFQTWVTLYVHWDGGGLGARLSDFLKPVVLTNGLPLSLPQDGKRYCNGAGCLFAQLIAHLKQEPGNVYVASPDTPPQEYAYDIDVDAEHGTVTEAKVSDHMPPDRFSIKVLGRAICRR